MGIKNPIHEFVVAPRMVIASPIVGTTIAMPQAAKIKQKVQMKFYKFVNFFRCFPRKSSSTESLAGRTQNGDAKRTTNKIRNPHAFIILL